MLQVRYRVQLTVFAIVSAIALTIVSVSYVRLPSLLGFGQMHVYADFSDVSGLYPDALVTYRGVDIGKVDGLDLSPSGVRVSMQIDSDKKIPNDVVAQIHSTSAIGEQYVDLVPNRDGGPYVKAGFTIARDRTVGMPQAGVLLDSVTKLVNSIPKDALVTLLNRVNTAFRGTGADLNTLISQATLFVAAAEDNIGPTTSLLTSLKPFLSTQQALAGQITTSVSNLASFTGTLANDNSNLVKILKSGAPFADQVNTLVDDLNPTLPVLLTNMVTTSQVLMEYLPGLQQTLVLLPATVAGLQGALLPYKASHGVVLDFKLDVNPPTCTDGFLPSSERRDPRDTTSISTPPGIYCKSSPTGPADIRGAHNYPCELYPGYRAATAELCAEEATGHPEKVPAVAYLPSDATSVATAEYEPSSGRFIGPDGQFYALGSGSSGKPLSTWQSLLLSTLGRKTS